MGLEQTLTIAHVRAVSYFRPEVSVPSRLVPALKTASFVFRDASFSLLVPFFSPCNCPCITYLGFKETLTCLVQALTLSLCLYTSFYLSGCLSVYTYLSILSRYLFIYLCVRPCIYRSIYLCCPWHLRAVSDDITRTL